MAQLTFITETGMFHSAARCTWGSQVEWYGFKPKTHRAPAGAGMVDRSDRSTMINHAITYDVDGNLLRRAVAKVAADYASETYVLLACDCVSFTADIAREMNLRVPLLNYTPYGFMKVLAFWNTPASST